MKLLIVGAFMVVTTFELAIGYSHSTGLVPRCINEDEIYQVCSRKIPITCQQPKQRYTNGRCVTGCFCKPGLLRDLRTWECVASNTCDEKREEIFVLQEEEDGEGWEGELDDSRFEIPLN